MMKDKMIEGMGVIAKLNDGKHYQLMLTNENSKKVLELICQLEEGIKLIEPALEGVILE